MNAGNIWFDKINQMISGTSMMRIIVMRLGTLNLSTPLQDPSVADIGQYETMGGKLDRQGLGIACKAHIDQGALC
jgi:hypothetical protein